METIIRTLKNIGALFVGVTAIPLVLIFVLIILVIVMFRENQ